MSVSSDRGMLNSWPFEPHADPIHCVNFVNTVSYRGGSQRRDWLAGYPEFVDWCGEEGLFTDDQVAKLRVEENQTAFERALSLREAQYAVLASKAIGSPVSGSAEKVVAEFFEEALVHVRLSGDIWTFAGLGNSAESALWPLAVSSGLLLASEQLARVRVCANEECAWMFIDSSKNRSRKWCEMSTCGNVIKARRFYHKHKAR